MSRRTRNVKRRIDGLEGGGNGAKAGLPELSLAQLLSDGDGVKEEQKWRPIAGEPYLYEGPHGRLYQALYLRDSDLDLRPPAQSEETRKW